MLESDITSSVVDKGESPEGGGVDEVTCNWGTGGKATGFGIPDETHATCVGQSSGSVLTCGSQLEMDVVPVESGTFVGHLCSCGVLRYLIEAEKRSSSVDSHPNSTDSMVLEWGSDLSGNL